MLDQTDTLYFPKAHPDRERVSPRQGGFDPAKLQTAVKQAGEIDALN